MSAREELAEALAITLDEHVGWQMHRAAMGRDLADMALSWLAGRLGANLLPDERQALADWWDSDWPHDEYDVLDTLAETVEDILRGRGL